MAKKTTGVDYVTNKSMATTVKRYPSGRPYTLCHLIEKTTGNSLGSLFFYSIHNPFFLNSLSQKPGLSLNKIGDQVNALTYA